MSDTIRLIAEFFAACVGTIAFAPVSYTHLTLPTT